MANRTVCNVCGQKVGEHTLIEEESEIFGNTRSARCPTGEVSEWSIHSIQYMKEEKQKVNNQEVLAQARQLSSNTISYLIKDTNYEQIDKSQTEFVLFIYDATKQYNSWQDAWMDYQQHRLEELKKKLLEQKERFVKLIEEEQELGYVRGYYVGEAAAYTDILEFLGVEGQNKTDFLLQVDDIGKKRAAEKLDYQKNLVD